MTHKACLDDCGMTDRVWGAKCQDNIRACCSVNQVLYQLVVVCIPSHCFVLLGKSVTKSRQLTGLCKSVHPWGGVSEIQSIKDNRTCGRGDAGYCQLTCGRCNCAESVSQVLQKLQANTFLQAATMTGMKAQFDLPGFTATVLAPSDAAFATFLHGTVIFAWLNRC